MSTVFATSVPSISRTATAVAATACSGIPAELLLKHVKVTRRRVSAGEYIFRAGSECAELNLVHSGCIKSTIASADGREKVTGFHMRGELIGLESLGMNAHTCDAIALDDGEVWEFGYAELLSACARSVALQRGFANALAAEIRSERNWMLAVGTLGAEQRVAALLLELGERLLALGYSGTHFLLRMTRAEIGSFLGLQLETVTRALTQLCERGLIEVQRRDIRILDVAALRALINCASRLH